MGIGPSRRGNKPGPSTLSNDVVIGGTIHTAETVYVANDINEAVTSWAPRIGADTLVLAGSGDPPTKEYPGVFADNSAAVRGHSVGSGIGDGQTFVCTANSVTEDIGTDDFIWEFVYTTPASFPHTMFYGAWWIQPSEAGLGWYQTTNGNAQLVMESVADGQVSPTLSTTLATSTTYHVMIFCNRDEASTYGLRLYVNGSIPGASATRDPSGVQGSIGSATRNRGLGGTEYGAQAFNGDIYSHRQWSGADMFSSGEDGANEMVAIALGRAQYLGLV